MGQVRIEKPIVYKTDNRYYCLELPNFQDDSLPPLCYRLSDVSDRLILALNSAYVRDFFRINPPVVHNQVPLMIFSENPVKEVTLFPRLGISVDFRSDSGEAGQKRAYARIGGIESVSRIEVRVTSKGEKFLYSLLDSKEVKDLNRRIRMTGIEAV